MIRKLSQMKIFMHMEISVTSKMSQMKDPPVDAERERLREEAVREYSQMARNAKRRRGDREELRGQSKLQRVLNWW